LPIDAEGRVLRIANALWVQQGFPIRPEYSQLVKLHYGGDASAVDFVRAPDQAVATVNAWAEQKTAGRIKGLLIRDNINEMTRLILTNSVYFKGDWLSPFKANQTAKRPFLLPGGGSVPAVFMRQRGRFRAIRQPGFQALEAPYKGEELSMVLFVPGRADGLGEFERDLTGEKLDRWLGALMAQQPGDVEFVMPKLQTFLTVDEKGTEAAVVTAALMEQESRPTEFHADRPFFFLIRDNRSGAILFMGRISDPTTMI
jgi:serpin B